MTPQELKNSILQRAIQGKLVEQRPEEGTAEELFKQIQAEKHALIKAGKIKKEKPLPEITEDEIPFEIPESWKWVRLGNAIREVIVPMRDKPPFSMRGIPWCRIEDRDGVLLSRSKSNQLVSEDTIKEMNLKVLPVGTVLSACTGGSIGTIVINTVECCTNQTFNGIVCSSGLYNWFIFWFLTSKFNELRQVGTGTTIAYVSQNKSKMMLLPLPPLAEQKRIVAKIEELLPLVERYEAAWNRLEEFNKRFPSDMQKSILQLAIQGKLVEQRPEEGTGEELYQKIQAEKQALVKAGKLKKQKPLPEITEDEVPFEIPEGWKWVRFSDLYLLSNGTASRGSPGGTDHPVLRLADLSNNSVKTDNIRSIPLTDKEYGSHILQNDDLVFIRVNGSKDRVASAYHYKAKESISYCDHLFCGHRTSELVYAEYIMFIFNCPSTRKQLLPEIKTTAGQNTISQTSMAKILLPLPPLAEQNRIVARLEELLPLCERLK